MNRPRDKRLDLSLTPHASRREFPEAPGWPYAFDDGEIPDVLLDFEPEELEYAEEVEAVIRRE